MTGFLSDKVLANGPHFALAILANFLTCMHTNDCPSTSGLYTDSKIKFSMPSFTQNLNFCQFGHVLDHVLLF